MKTLRILLIVLLVAGFYSVTAAQAQDGDEGEDAIVNTGHRMARGMARGGGLGFIDEDANGINDRLQDADGDGVINVLDPDSDHYRDPTTVVHGLGFIDEDGDGISDRLQDADGDGVINVLDPDSDLYRNPASRGGSRFGRGKGHGFGFVDEDGDGISDRLQDADGDGVINVLDPDSEMYRDPATTVHGRGFIDEDGDGIGDHLQDADGDGVINALDPDSDFYRAPNSRGAGRRGGMRGGGRR